MTLPTSVRTPERDAGELVYRSVSPLAVAGLALALLYALLIVVAGTYAFFSHTPLMLEGWTYVFPIGAAGLSVAGWWQVRRSEGTRVGLGLARWGLRFSVLFGLGYWAYDFANELALRLDAEQYALKWFEKMREGDLNTAFLMTLDPQKREGLRPNDPQDMRRFMIPGDMGKSMFQGFADQRLSRLVRQGGTACEVEPRGVRKVEYEQQSYVVHQVYQVRTREGVFDFLLTIRSSPAKAGSKGPRQWYLQAAEVVPPGNPTELGMTMAAWGKQASEFADRWFAKISRGDMLSAYWETIDPVERQRLLPEYRHRTAGWLGTVYGLVSPDGGVGSLAGGSALLLASRKAAEKALPANPEDFFQAKFVEEKPIPGVDDPVFQAELYRFLRKALLSPDRYYVALGNQGDLQLWDEVDGRVRIRPLFKGMILEKQVQTKGYRYELVVVVESDPGPIDPNRHPAWRVVRVEVSAAGTPEKPTNQPPGNQPPVGAAFPGR